MKLSYLVLGVGRSGTSSVCRVLAERFGACFGRSVLNPMRDPQDTRFRVYEPNGPKAALHSYLRREGVFEAFTMELDREHAHPMKRAAGDVYRPTECKRSLKLLRLIALDRDAFLSLDAELTVITIRGDRSCAEAWSRYTGKSVPRMEDYVAERQRLLQRAHAWLLEANRPTITMLFEPQRHVWTDDEIAARIEKGD